jgi:hypothetical protein
MDFELFRVNEDHEALRDAVRTLARDKIAVHAAEVDENEEFPRDAYQALVAGDFHAPHIPEEYGGVGADALATCIVIEEVARACASSSLIPAVNKLGSLPLLLAGSEELKRRYLPPIAAGEAMFSYALSEREAGSDTASMRARATGTATSGSSTAPRRGSRTPASPSTTRCSPSPTRTAGGARTSARSSSRGPTPASRSAPRSASSASRGRRRAR